MNQENGAWKKEVDLLDQLFPFHIILDFDLQVIHTGPKVYKIHSSCKIGSTFLDCFTPLRPKELKHPEDFENASHSIIIVKSTVKKDLKFRIQAVMHEEPNAIILLCSPILLKVQEVKDLDLKFKDFPVHDTLPDFLFMLYAQENTILETEELARKFKHQAERLEKMSELMRQFSSIVAHNLRSPIMGLKTLHNFYIDQFENLTEDEKGNYKDKFLERTDYLISLTEKLWKFTSVGQSIRQPRELNVEELIVEIIEQQNKDDVKVEFENKIPNLILFKEDVVELFFNVISNAINYRSNGYCMITISSKEIKNDFIEFTISDNGIGIEKKYHDKVFKPFEILGKKYDSLGMGLTMVKRIVEYYEGEVRLESELGKGTKVIFSLPKNIEQLGNLE